MEDEHKENTKLLDRHLAQTTLFPLSIEVDRAEGIYIYDKSGKAYADMISGIGVSNIGHGNRNVIEAIRKQSEKHLHVMVYGEFLQEAQSDFANLLTAQLPNSLDTVYFVNSGAEAIEASLKLAKRFTGRSKIISCQGSYHGNTHGALSVSGNEKKKNAFRPLLPDVHFVLFNEPDELALIDEHTACFIMETVQGDAGVRIPSLEYLKALRQRCDETGTILIFDEIQCGFGRTGKLYAFMHWNVLPDILVSGKALGGGLPIGAVISSRKMMKQFTVNPMLGHITTFGGHPLICAAGNAALEWMLNENILSDVELKGARIKSILEKHSLVLGIRQIGLFIAIDMLNEEVVRQTVEKCLERGVIMFWFLSCPWSFRLAPPLSITMLEIERHCQTIFEVMSEVQDEQKRSVHIDH